MDVTAAAVATSLSDLIETIPHPYRPALGAYLGRKYRIMRKYAAARRDLSSYQRHLNRGTFPVSIRAAIKVPIFRFTEEFLVTSEHASASARINFEILTARKYILKRVILQKTAELAFLSTLARDDGTDWKCIAVRVASGLAQAYGWLVVHDDHGCVHFDGMPVVADRDFVGICDNYNVYATRLAYLVQARRRPASQSSSYGPKENPTKGTEAPHEAEKEINRSGTSSQKRPRQN
ncbi:hypothetical protein HIM_10809 [Hirsutella minnesotensis 3608]|uniref:Uncharacterized protein n=1 Tax=Hirsutella minnesotensis 3608 TaxID=1043627 RepID=A0A0F7ZFV3_9HYPO|nr:hypothetical protein HIM_10809 [Hirsutella minnesotensis 3608]